MPLSKKIGCRVFPIEVENAMDEWFLHILQLFICSKLAESGYFLNIYIYNIFLTGLHSIKALSKTVNEKKRHEGQEDKKDKKRKVDESSKRLMQIWRYHHLF